PSISVSKSSNPASGTSVNAGDTITYTLTAVVSNAALTSPLVLTDTLSANQTFGSVTVPGSFSCIGSVTCTLPTGTVPGTYTVEYTATVNANASGSVGNNVIASGGGPTPPSCTTCSTTHPLSDPSISVSKVSNPASGTSVNAGDTITYTLTAVVSNAALTSPLVLTDTLSANQTFGSVTAPGSFNCIGSVQCTLPIGTVPGTYTVEYTATVNADASGSVGNNVIASGGSPTPPSCTTCSTTHPLSDPSISVSKTSNPASGASVNAGDTITYTLTAVVTNSALTSALVLTDTLSGDQTFTAVTNAGSFTPNTSGAPVLIFTLPSGTPPGSYALTYTASVDADASGSVGNSVTGSGGGGTPPACGTTCTTIHPLQPNVSVAKALVAESGSIAGVAEPGETLTYAITLSNSGGVAATAIGISDPLDPIVNFVSADNGGSYSSGVVTWSGLTVPAGGTLTLTVQVQVSTPIPTGTTQVTNLAYLTGSTPPTCPPAGPQCVVTPTLAELSVTKAVSGESITTDGIAEPGEDITWTITVRNQGGTAALGTIVNEVVPANTTFVSGAPAWTCAPGAPAGTSCDALVDVPAQVGGTPGIVTLIFTVKVDDPLPNGVTSIANAVALNDGTSPDCTALPNAPGCSVVPTANLRLSKVVDSLTPTGSGRYVATYRISVINVGGSPTNYTLTDTLRFTNTGVVFTGNAQVTTTGGTLNPGLSGGQFVPMNGTIVQLSANGVSVAVGATHIYLVRVPIGVQPAQLQDGVCTGAPGHGLFNEAAVSGIFNLDSAACAPVTGDVPLIHLLKTVSLGQDFNGNQYGDVGDVLEYQFTISNPGSLPLNTVQLFDPRLASLQCSPFTHNGGPFRVIPGDEVFYDGFNPLVGGGTLPPGDAVDCTGTYTLTAADVSRRRVVNTATATGNASDGQAVSSVATAIFTQFR
ncbi:MAG: hypothetical protein WAU14_01350, partial [Dokdonella sp.]|uniref:DUF7507 domain-containing protein n=1 Tax=Dokdonella sp. TaxID=2291710 RepID=UPI003BAF9846